MNTHVLELCEMAEDALFDAQFSGDITYLKEALSLYQEALAYKAPLAAPYLGLACIAYARGDYSQVQGLLGLAERLEPTHPDVLELKQRLKVSNTSESALFTSPAEASPIARLSLAPETRDSTEKEQSSAEVALALTQDLGPPLEKSAVSEGPEVLLLQNILHTLGYAVQSSGRFDAATRSALTQFQHHRGLRLRRVVDQELRDALMKSLIEG